MARHIFRIPVFDGGLNTKANPTAIKINQSPDLQNVDFDDYGAVGTRSGVVKFNTAPIDSAVVDGITEYSQNDGTKYVAACGGSIYQCTGTTFYTVGSSQGLYSAGVDVEFETFHNLCFVENGVQEPYKYNGAEYTRAGVSAPTGTVSSVSDGTGVLSGTYAWAFSGVNSYNAETDIGVLGATAVVSGAQVTLTGIPTMPASAGINEIFVYRNTATTEGVYYRVTSITNGVTSLTDNNADADLLTDAPTDNGVMPKCKYLTTFGGRIFAAGNSDNPMWLYFSNTNAPETWPSTNYLRIGEGDGEPITGVKAFTNGVVIHKNAGKGRGSIWILHMPDSTDVTDASNWYLFKSPSAYGGESHRALAFFDNLQFFLNRYGAYALEGKEIARSAADSSVGRFMTDSHSFDIEPDIADIKKTLINGCSAITYDNKVWLAVPKGATSTANNTIYTYDFVRASDPERRWGAWSKHTGDYASVGDWTEFGGDLLGSSDTINGQIYKFNTGTNDDGNAIDSYFKTAALFGYPEHRDYYKMWRYLYLLIEASGDWTVNVTYINDFSDTPTTATVNVDPGGNKWGTAVWNTTKWGGELDRIRTKIILLNSVSKTIQLKFNTNTADQYFKVHEAELHYTLRGLRG